MGSYTKYNVVDTLKGQVRKVEVEYPGVDSTGEFIFIRSRHSKEFREADAKANRQVSSMVLANKGQPLDETLVEDIISRAFAALVDSWTFDEPCTPENISDFLAKNPQMYDLINVLSAEDSFFFNKKDSD